MSIISTISSGRFWSSSPAIENRSFWSDVRQFLWPNYLARVELSCQSVASWQNPNVLFELLSGPMCSSATKWICCHCLKTEAINLQHAKMFGTTKLPQIPYIENVNQIREWKFSFFFLPFPWFLCYAEKMGLLKPSSPNPHNNCPVTWICSFELRKRVESLEGKHPPTIWKASAKIVLIPPT